MEMKVLDLDTFSGQERVVKLGGREYKLPPEGLVSLDLWLKQLQAEKLDGEARVIAFLESITSVLLFYNKDASREEVRSSLLLRGFTNLQTLTTFIFNWPEPEGKKAETGPIAAGQ